MNKEHPIQTERKDYHFFGNAMLVLLSLFCYGFSSFAQTPIAHIQPDALAPGMTIAIEILAPAKDTGAFGSDGIYLPQHKISLVNPLDSFRVIFGPVQVSWNGRVLQLPVMALASSATGSVPFQIIIGNRKTAVAFFSVVQPQQINLNGDAELGDGGIYGLLSAGNTLVVEGLNLAGQDIVNKGLFRFSTADPDVSKPGNLRYHPITILSKNTVTLFDAIISVSADTINGGPGGGGGGHGFSGSGGAGYTGGGSDSTYANINIGSGDSSTVLYGGASSTGVRGGASSNFNSDQGGGGGTGCPYGSSGIFSSGNDTSQAGGYGGGSAGGEQPGRVYGGGGGGFATDGKAGSGLGSNGGHSNGGRFLMPLQGGSGGGGGNALQGSDSTAGSGGGGGGAITIISYDKITISETNLFAKGGVGTPSLKAQEAGGGGGSGGGIFIGSRNGALLSQAYIDVSGATGGLGGSGLDTTSKGGAGGLGRIRIDGPYNDSCVDCSLTTHVLSGPIIQPSTTRLIGPFANIVGIAGSDKELLDSIRIFYRNHHSSWQFKDTVRLNQKSLSRWQVELPMGHDSLLFVTVFEKVNTPHASFADHEPDWLTGHLGSAIISIVPTPHLVLQNDTINFGSIKFDQCDSASFVLSNFGEEFLHIDSITTTNPKFTVIKGKNIIGLYESDSILLGFCPGVVGCDTATLIVHSGNDTVRFVHLLGCGIDKDQRLTLSKPVINFGKVHISDCDTLQITVRSVGKDSILFKPSAFIKTPFEIIKPKADTLLGTKDSVRLTIRFCPIDSGAFRSSFILSNRQDSVVATGIGTVRIFQAPARIIGATLCPNQCDSTTLLCSSLGNEAVLITGATGATILSPKLPFVMPPLSDTEIVIQYCTNPNGDSLLRITYQTNADTVSSTLITINPTRILLSVVGNTSLGPICTQSCDSTTITIIAANGDSILRDNIHLNLSTQFLLKTSPGIGDSLDIHLKFCPTQIGKVFDTLFIPIHAGLCDSVIAIPLVGTAINSVITFSRTTVDFGIVDTGLCKDDSLTISLSCGNAVQLQLQPLVKPFTLISPSNGLITLTSGGITTIVYRYCPDSASSDSLDSHITATGFDTLITLFGSGRVLAPNPYIHFILQKESVLAGKDFSYLISIDSLRESDNIHSISGQLRFDPLLIEPRTIQSLQPQWNVGASESKPGEFSITASGSSSLTKGAFASVVSKSFYNDLAVTPVTFDNIVTTPLSISGADTGTVRVTTCSDLPGNIIVAGTYSFDGLRNNPVSSQVLFDLTIGTVGRLTIKLINAAGLIVQTKTVENIEKGKHRVELDVSSLPSGVYQLMLDSWGWYDGCSFVIQR